MLKLIAYDMDYTMLQTGGTLSTASEEALLAAVNQGIAVVPVTGRGLRELEGLLPSLHAQYAVLVNGAVVYDLARREVIYRETADQTIMLDMLKKAIDMGLYTEVYSGEVYTNPFSYDNMEKLGMLPDQAPMFKATRTVVPDLYQAMEQVGSMEKIHLIFRNVADKKRRQSIFLGHPDLSYTAAYTHNLELCSKKVDKASGLAALTKHLGIKSHEVMALGDGANDASMLRWAG